MLTCCLHANRDPLLDEWLAGTNYIETLRVQVHANCRIRRIYFSDRLYSEEELPPEFKLFLPIQVSRVHTVPNTELTAGS